MADTPNYDCASLHLETDSAGFILGQSFLGDNLTDEANVWREVKTDFTSISLTRSVSVEKGVMFRPEAASMTVNAPGTSYMSGSFGRRIRLRWKDTVLFEGTVKSASLASQPDADGVKTRMILKAVDRTEALNSYVLYNFYAPAQTAGSRISSITDAVVTNCNRLMPIRPSTNIQLMTVVQEAADAQLARIYVNSTNQLVVSGDAAPEPTILFSDVHEGEHVCYSDLSMVEDVSNTITSVVVEAKQDETLSAIATHPSAVLTNQEVYQVDVPLNQADVNAWAASFPLKASTSLEPNSISVKWGKAPDTLASGIELLHLVNVQWAGNSYRSGVQAITHTITPGDWTVDLDLMPGHLLEFSSVLAPSVPLGFKVSSYTDTTAALSWSRPQTPNSMTGYEIRYVVGSTPPTKTTGSVLATVNGSTHSFTHSGLSSNTAYAYSIFAVTDNPSIFSARATTTVHTNETVPTAPRNFTLTKGANVQTWTLDWDAPSSLGDIKEYVLYAGGAGSGSRVIPLGTTSHTYTSLERNEEYTFWVRGRTYGGKLGPATPVLTADTAETVPTAVRTFTSTAVNYSTINLYWDAPTTTGDLAEYVIMYKKGTSAPTSTSDGALLGVFPKNQVSTSVYDLQGATTYSFSIWPRTVGNLYGPRSSTTRTTPQGIFSKYWEGQASWAQTYQGDNTKRTDTSDLYYGYYLSMYGNMRSMAGFAVPSEVNGAYAVDKVVLRFYNQHTYLNSGATCWLGTHTASAEPSTFTGSTRLGSTSVPKGGWVEIDITSWAASRFRGGARGIVWGPPSSTSTSYYGYASGSGSTRPTLKIWYRTQGS